MSKKHHVSESELSNNNSKKKPKPKKKNNSSSSEESNSSSSESDIPSQLAISVEKWVELDNNIKKLNKKAKDLKKEKEQYEDAILEIMTKHDKTSIIISGGKLIRNVSKCKESLKQEFIQKALLEVMKDQKKAADITQYILNKRPIKEREYLKRTKSKA